MSPFVRLLAAARRSVCRDTADVADAVGNKILYPKERFVRASAYTYFHTISPL